MAAKKNVEEVKNTQETVAEEPVVEVVDETITEDANTATEAEATEEKKEGFIKKFWNKQVSEFKEHPVKKTLKTVGGAAVGVLAVIGGKTVINSIMSNDDVAENTVELLTDSVSDAIEDVKVEEF